MKRTPIKDSEAFSIIIGDHFETILDNVIEVIDIRIDVQKSSRALYSVSIAIRTPEATIRWFTPSALIPMLTFRLIGHKSNTPSEPDND